MSGANGTDSESSRELCSAIEDMLTTEIVGSKIVCYDSVSSTNDAAKELALEYKNEGKEFDGTLVIAFEQTGGKGRLGREWHSPRGGVWLSVAFDASDWGVVQRLSMISGIAAADTLKEFGIDAKLKWPNDVVVEDKKLAGILCETIAKGDKAVASVIGIGVNLDFHKDALPNDLQDTATTALDILGDEVNPADFIVSLAENIEKRYNELLNDELESLVETYSGMLETLGKEVHVETSEGELKGTAIDITDEGALVIDTPEGTATIRSGECKHLRSA